MGGDAAADPLLEPIQPPISPPSHRRPGRRRIHHFADGSAVEVRTNEEDFKGVYFSATVRTPPNKKSGKKKSRKLYVEYHNLLANEDGLDRLSEYVDVACVRPVPPVQKVVKGFEPDDLVDAFYKDGWWTGIVNRVVDGGERFVVTFNNPPDELEFGLAELREHLDWVDGNWIRPQKQSISGLMFDVGRKVEVSFDREDFQDNWFPATILEDLGNGAFSVERNGAMIENHGPVKVRVDLLHIRPCPPLLKDKNFVLLEKVDAYFEFGWWSGIITKELEHNRYIVFFKQMKCKKEFSQWELRPHMEWKDGKWFTSSQEPSVPSLDDGVCQHPNPENSNASAATAPLSNSLNVEDTFGAQKHSSLIATRGQIEQFTPNNQKLSHVSQSLRKRRAYLSVPGCSFSQPLKKLREGNLVEENVMDGHDGPDIEILDGPESPDSSNNMDKSVAQTTLDLSSAYHPWEENVQRKQRNIRLSRENVISTSSSREMSAAQILPLQSLGFCFREKEPNAAENTEEGAHHEHAKHKTPIVVVGLPCAKTGESEVSGVNKSQPPRKRLISDFSVGDQIQQVLNFTNQKIKDVKQSRIGEVSGQKKRGRPRKTAIGCTGNLPAENAERRGHAFDLNKTDDSHRIHQAVVIGMEASISGQEITMPNQEKTALNQQETVPNPEKTAPHLEKMMPSQQKVMRNLESKAPNEEKTMQNQEKKALNPEKMMSSQETTKHNQEKTTPNQEKTLPNQGKTTSKTSNQGKTTPDQEMTLPNQGKTTSKTSNQEKTTPNQEKTLPNQGKTTSKTSNQEKTTPNQEMTLPNQGKTTSKTSNLGMAMPNQEKAASYQEKIANGHSGPRKRKVNMPKRNLASKHEKVGVEELVRPGENPSLKKGLWEITNGRIAVKVRDVDGASGGISMIASRPVDIEEVIEPSNDIDNEPLSKWIGELHVSSVTDGSRLPPADKVGRCILNCGEQGEPVVLEEEHLESEKQSSYLVDKGPTKPQSFSSENNTARVVPDERTRNRSLSGTQTILLVDKDPIEVSEPQSLPSVKETASVLLDPDRGKQPEIKARATAIVNGSPTIPSQPQSSVRKTVGGLLNEKRPENGTTVAPASVDKAGVVPSEPENLPFVKNTVLWRTIEAMDVFQKMPQQPHFEPLKSLKESSREGLAIGYMVTFSSLVERASKLQLNDPISVIEDTKETLADLERHGFDVRPIQDRISKMLDIKDKEEKLANSAQTLYSQITEHSQVKTRIETEIEEINGHIERLQMKLAQAELVKGREDEEIAFLQVRLREAEDSSKALKNEFEGIVSSIL